MSHNEANQVSHFVFYHLSHKVESHKKHVPYKEM